MEEELGQGFGQGYGARFKEAEEAILAAQSCVGGALDTARGGRREHVQMLDAVRETLDDALAKLRKARPNDIW
jgi:hypothetical protein